MIPAMKYWVKRDAAADVVVEHGPEHHQQDHREQQREDDGLALPEELLELDPGRGCGTTAGSDGRRRAGLGGGHAGSPIIRR